MSDAVSAGELLRNTTYLMSLARRAALSSPDAAERQRAVQLGSVLRELKALGATPPTAVPAENMRAGEGFNRLLEAARGRSEPAAQRPAGDPLERTTVALGMAQAGAQQLDIAKALGMSRGEVDVILNIARQQT
ncbi:MAG: hypothetical protein DWG81_00955 [Chloroflexi bacterium]|nr:hypothetical protein [Chloroflexota bacterium]MDA1216647.1 hypothetical protein [Chloroflexota bacterium]MQC24500.1 hypothetical protein [Chloroflexota bacterium]